jgi:type VI secretion system secreted protein VgrG
MSHHDVLTFTIESSHFACDDLAVRRFTGKESIGHLFEYDLEVVCKHHDGPDPDTMTGAEVTLVIERFEGQGAGWDGVRRLHGVVAEVDDLLSGHADLRVYRLHVVPHAFALALVETQDIFMGLCVPDLIKAKLGAVGLTDVDFRLIGTYAERELVVQYKESDLAFISRLAEHLGISFFFEHGELGEKMVFTDHPGGFGHADSPEPLPFRARGDARDVFALEAKRRMIPAFYAVRDYNYRKPLLEITAEHELASAFPGGVIEYGTHHKTLEEGKILAVVRAEERRAAQLVYTGKSAVPALSAGSRFTLDHPDLGAIELLVTEVEHQASQVVHGVGSAGEPGYANTFRAIPADRAYRPPRVTPKPRIAGLITGVIDAGGAPGTPKYAQLDSEGRYTVRFLFDTTPRGERPASRPVRMLQNHVGEGYGTHFPLKPGVEVAIGFIDGDPDRPLIVGAAPNAMTPSPVNNENPGVHRIRTSSGIVVDMAE